MPSGKNPAKLSSSNSIFGSLSVDGNVSNASRRRFLQQMLSAGAALCMSTNSYAGLLDGYLFNSCLSPLPPHLVQHPIVTSAWEGIDAERFLDCHTHIAGTGDSGSGIYTTAEMSSIWHPIQFAQRKFYLNAACTDSTAVDHSYVEHLRHLLDELKPGCKSLLLAFDQVYDGNGTVMPEQTAFYIPNDYARDLAHNFPEHFEWAASIHPYRADAVDALEAAVEQGALAVKWLPPAMGIDPASPKCDAFYAALSRLGIPIISHAGAENAVQGAGMSEAGNPLRLRRALDAGVRIVVAHCASEGEDEDEDGSTKLSFELFAKMMDMAEYRGYLFADISAITLRNRSPQMLREIIEHEDWHSRLLNGTDYPLPGVLPLLALDKMMDYDLLESEVVPVLYEIQNYNPLLFNFVLKRQLRSGEYKLADSIFHTRDFFQRRTS